MTLSPCGDQAGKNSWRTRCLPVGLEATESCELNLPAAVGVHHVHLGKVGEDDLVSLRRPGREELVTARRVRDVRRAGAVCVHGVDVVLIHRHRGVADEGESGRVRRPVLVEVEQRIVRDPRDAAPVGIHGVDLEVAVAGRTEGDSTGHGARGDAVGCRIVGDVRLAGAVCVHDVDLGIAEAGPATLAREDDPPVVRPGRIPVVGRVVREPGLSRPVRVHLVDLE